MRSGLTRGSGLSSCMLRDSLLCPFSWCWASGYG